MLNYYSVIGDPFQGHLTLICVKVHLHLFGSFCLLHECPFFRTATPFILPIAQIKMNIKAVRGFYLAIHVYRPMPFQMIHTVHIMFKHNYVSPYSNTKVMLQLFQVTKCSILYATQYLFVLVHIIQAL